MFSMDAVPPAPFALSLSFDRLKTIGNTNAPNTKPTPFGLSLPFDKLRMIGNTNTPNTKPTPFGLSLPFDKLRTIGNTNTPNTKPAPFGLSLSKPCHQSRGTSTGSARAGSFLCLKFLASHP
jgi:hypothetical protein